MTEEIYISEKSLAKKWSLSPKTLQRWRWMGLGPSYIKIGGRVRYSLKSIKEFELKNIAKNSNNSEKLTKKNLLKTEETNYESQQN